MKIYFIILIVRYLFIIVKIIESDLKIDDQFVEEINCSLNHNKYLSNKNLTVIDKIDKIDEDVEEENKNDNNEVLQENDNMD